MLLLLSYLQMVFVILICLMVVAQLLIVFRYCSWMNSIRSEASVKQDWGIAFQGKQPNVAVLVGVRGIEDNLRSNLESILRQKFVQPQLHLIVDSWEDSSVTVLRQLEQEFPQQISLHCFPVENTAAGLKPLGLAHTCQKLLTQGDQPDYFAFSDADTTHCDTWLVRLLQQLSSSERIGAVTGQRWYLTPDEKTVENGTMVRKLWNAAALPQMYFYNVVWGGSWAIKCETLAESGLIDAWQTTLFEDTMVYDYVKRVGQQVQTVPGLFSYSQDQIDIDSAVYWISRQLLDTRMYHSAAPRIAGHGVLSAVLLLSPAIFALGLFASTSWLWPMIGFICFAGYQIGNLAIWLWLEQVARRCQKLLPYTTSEKRLNRATIVKTLLLTQVLYPVAAIRSLRMNQVTWRGIKYRWAGPFEIKRENYQPMKSDLPV